MCTLVNGNGVGVGGEESFADAQDRSGCSRPVAEFILSEAEGLRVI